MVRVTQPRIAIAKTSETPARVFAVVDETVTKFPPLRHTLDLRNLYPAIVRRRAFLI
jgi:hypothetical protein